MTSQGSWSNPRAVDSWLIIVFILGAGQGVFLAAILMSKRPGSMSNRILAVLMLAFALDLGIAAYHATGTHEVFPHLIGIDFPLAFLYGPLLYLYARTLSHGEHIFRKVYLWHFLPFALLVIYLIPFFLQNGAEKLAFLRLPEPGLRMKVLEMVTHLKLVHAFMYIGAALLVLKRHRRRIRDTFSYTERVNLLWLRNLLAGIVILAVLTVVLYLLSLRDPAPVMGLDAETVYGNLTLLALAIFVYAIGFMGLRQPEVFNGRRREPFVSDAETAQDVSRVDGQPPNGHAVGVEHESNRPRYAKSGMGAETAERYKQKLLALMDTKKPYLRGDLTLQNLSEAVSISPHNLTEVINTQLGQNFYDFVNGYRVREAKERIADPEYAHLTLLAVGMEAGFNSKSAFNAVFKKHTGLTPSQFRVEVAEPVSA